MLKTAEWDNQTVHTYSIRWDGKSIIEVLSKSFNVNKTIDTIKQFAKEWNNIFKISYAKVHVGIQGKEDADALDTQH